MKILGLLFLVALAGFAQQPPGTAPRVEGRAINSLSGDPVKKATVLLQPRQAGRGTAYTADTDSDGRFVIEDVEPGVYTPTAERSGFMTQVQGAPGARPEPITVEPGQDLTAVTIRLVPLGVIAGRLLDEDGDPVRGAGVEAMVNGYVQGRKQLRVASQTQSNNHGDFRLYNLPPGTYYLRAAIRADRFQFISPLTVFSESKPHGGDAPTYYPSTTEPAGATQIVIAAGAQLKGIDIQMRRAKLYAVRGRQILDQAHRHVSLQIVPVDSEQSVGFSSGVRISSETFEFQNLLPGSYVIMAVRMDGEKRSFARESVQVVNGDVEGVNLAFAPGADVAGVVRIEGALPSGSPIAVSLQLETPSPFGQPNTTAKPDGSFELHDVAPEIYRVNVGPIQGSYLKSIRLGDREVNDERLDLTRGPVPQLVLTLATDVGQIEGKVQTAGGDPAVRVRVTCHSLRSDLSRSAFTDEKGSFRMTNVPPGEYKIFAWEDVPMGAPQDPEFRKPFEKQSVPLNMPPNGHETVELTSISVKPLEMR
ncbi:MAG TPA: carboxypeptidase-like regulatory domain-containing protein [Bryobacteraceae bacterium]